MIGLFTENTYNSQMAREKQQQQAKNAFNDGAAKWQRKSAIKGVYSLIEHRNSIVLGELQKRPKRAKFLDIGCGTGQLVIEAGKNDYEAIGVDYAEEMIRHCNENRLIARTQAEFQFGSIFDLPVEKRSFEVVSALGFIEYLPQVQLEKFFLRVTDLISEKGLFLVGTRNRLFNITALNRFSEIEIELGNFENLTQQAIAFQDVSPTGNLEFLDQFGRIEPQPETHPETGGIRVDTRYQYSPGEICHRLKRAGYVVERIYPVHYHPFPPACKSDHLEEHARVAAYAQQRAPRDLRLVPWCSSMIISAYRKT